MGNVREDQGHGEAILSRSTESAQPGKAALLSISRRLMPLPFAFNVGSAGRRDTSTCAPVGVKQVGGVFVIPEWVPVNEAWLWKNADALCRVAEGIEEARLGRSCQSP
jgi:hypothetical protein